MLSNKVAQQSLPPARKPRKRTIAKLYGIEKAKERFLERLAEIGTVSETLEKLNIPWNRFHYWRDSDPEFCRKWDKIARRLQAANREKVSKLVPKALEVYDQALGPKTDMKHRLHAADKVLGSEGIIQEPVKKEEIKGVIGLFNADDIAREFREARKRILETSSGPVGVPDNPSKAE